MTLDEFFGYWLIAFLSAYFMLVIFKGLRAIFPAERERIRVDFKHYDD